MNLEGSESQNILRRGLASLSDVEHRMENRMRPTLEAIEAAENIVRGEIEGLAADLGKLHERAKAAREDAARLTALKPDGEKIERAIRTAKEQYEGVAKREADPMNGESVNGDHARQVLEARQGLQAI